MPVFGAVDGEIPTTKHGAFRLGNVTKSSVVSWDAEADSVIVFLREGDRDQSDLDDDGIVVGRTEAGDVLDLEIFDISEGVPPAILAAVDGYSAAAGATLRKLLADLPEDDAEIE